MTTRRLRTERVIESTLAACALLTVLITFGIIWTLFSETVMFFRSVRLFDFLTDTQWTPLFADKHFGILPLLTGTLLTTLIAVYLREYATATFRRVMQPLLEILAAVPTVVYGKLIG